MRFLRIDDVLLATGHRSHTTIYNAVRDGLFTKPVPIGTRSVGWPDHEVLAICAARLAGQTIEEVRTLVNQLHTRRSAYAQGV